MEGSTVAYFTDSSGIAVEAIRKTIKIPTRRGISRSLFGIVPKYMSEDNFYPVRKLLGGINLSIYIVRLAFLKEIRI
jgi:hypothetical protein